MPHTEDYELLSDWLRAVAQWAGKLRALPGSSEHEQDIQDVVDQFQLAAELAANLERRVAAL